MTAQSTWENLLAGRVLDRSRGCDLPADGSTRVSQLAIQAAKEAIEQAGWGTLSDPRTAVIIGSSKGPIERWISEINCEIPPSPLIGVGELSFDIARAIGADRGPRLTFASACASGLQALIRADSLIKTNVCDRAVVVGAESSLHPLFEATFRRLGVLAKPEIGCRSFDISRDGFLISEAAAAVCLESGFSDAGTRKGVYIHRTALAGDPYHLTGMDPAGEGLRYLLRAVEASESDLIHAHGTATISADPIELAAIESITQINTTNGHDHPIAYSHKAAIGHTQGASGMISIVINVLAHRHNVVPPNSNTHTPITHQNVIISDLPQHRRIHTSTALAAGFGGTLAAVTLKSA